MSKLGKLFGSNSEKKESPTFNWIPLITKEQLDNLNENAVLFKHSTRCVISRSVIKSFENQSRELEGKVSFYYLDLLNYKDISAAIAEKFQVLHQSPQVVVVKNGELVGHGSHDNILGLDIESLIQ